MAIPSPIRIPTVSAVDELHMAVRTANACIDAELPGDLLYNVRERLVDFAFVRAWGVEITDLFSVLCDMLTSRENALTPIMHKFGAACWRAVRARTAYDQFAACPFDSYQCMLRFSNVSPAGFSVWAVVCAPTPPGPSWLLVPDSAGELARPPNPVAGLFWRASAQGVQHAPPAHCAAAGRAALAARAEWLLAAARRRSARRQKD